MIAIAFRWLAPLAVKGAAIAGLVFAAWLYLGHVERSAKREQKAADAAVVREATLQAELAATRLARLREARSAANTKDANDALVTDMASARRLLDAHLARLRGQAAQGRAGAVDMPSTADAAGIIVRADRDAVLADDLDRCTVAVTRLANAREWAIKELVNP